VCTPAAWLIAMALHLSFSMNFFLDVNVLFFMIAPLMAKKLYW
jgi:hypothetical protein